MRTKDNLEFDFRIFKTVILAFQIYSNQPDLLPIFRLTEPVPTKKLLSMSLNLLIPREDIWNCVTSTLKVSTRCVH